LTDKKGREMEKPMEIWQERWWEGKKATHPPPPTGGNEREDPSKVRVR